MSSSTVPKHIGLILDGNRRWAKVRSLPSYKGHQAGYEALRKIVDDAFSKGVEYISAFIFSTENWSRSKAEVSFLMKLTLQMVQRDLEEMHKKGIRIIWLGSEERVSNKLITALRNAEEITKHNTKGTLVLCFNYGGQQEIIDAAESVRKNNEEITQESLESALYSGNTVPPIDYVIRTSGEQRLSNFMLWRAAYSELYFTDVLWPDFSVTNLDEALAEYAKRQRRFGS
jgi:undecaprenyl diphosphate synthase